MTTQDYRTRRPLRIFLSYFRPHRGLFLLDITCAFFIAVIDLAFPLISRTAMYHWLPEKNYRVFFIVMAVVALAFVLRAARRFAFRALLALMRAASGFGASGARRSRQLPMAGRSTVRV